jgi:hypothetical protein
MLFFTSMYYSLSFHILDFAIHFASHMERESPNDTYLRCVDTNIRVITKLPNSERDIVFTSYKSKEQVL